MFNQYFGNYLLNKGLLSVDQLYDVFSAETSTRAKLGVLAIDAGLMNAAQVEEVHQLQHRMDKKFGEIALAQGYLTAGQLEDLLEAQKLKRLSLSQAVVDRGYLSLEQLQNALDTYKQETHIASRKHASPENADFAGISRMFVDFSPAGLNSDMLYDYVSLIMRNIVRFVGEQPVIDTAGRPVSGWLMSQGMTGEASMFTGLVLDEQVLTETARRYSGEPITEADALARDAIAEFLNETNGIFTVNMSDRGVELDLHPPTIQPTTKISLHTHFRIPLRFSYGQADLYISIFR